MEASPTASSNRVAGHHVARATIRKRASHRRKIMRDATVFLRAHRLEAPLAVAVKAVVRKQVLSSHYTLIGGARVRYAEGLARGYIPQAHERKKQIASGAPAVRIGTQSNAKFGAHEWLNRWSAPTNDAEAISFPPRERTEYTLAW